MADSVKFAEYTYLGAGTIVKVGHPAVPGGLDLVYGSGGTYPGLDRFGRVVDQTWQDTGGTPTVKDRYTYRYDYNSNRLYRKNELRPQLSELYRASDTSGAGTTHYDGYDGLNRLAAFHRGVLNADGDGIASGLGRSEAFGLVGLGNWRTYGVDSDGNGTNDLDQTRVHNEVNEIDTTDDHGDAAGDAIAATTGSNWIDPVYDAAGNMTQGPQPQNPLVAGTGETVRLHYAYDAWNRMTGVYVDDQGQPGAAQCTYGYDGLHRQVWRTPVGMPAHYYYNEAWQLVEEVYGLSTTQHVWDVRYIDAAVCSDGDGNHDGDCEDAATGVQGSNEGDWHQYYMQDANFNVTGLVDAYDGAVLQRYAYDPYGKPTVLHGVRDSQGTDTSASEWQVRTTFTLGNEFLYCGYRYDPLAGHYHVRHRVYHPTLGRWTARDPAGYKDGKSLYQYVGDNPGTSLDPEGLWRIMRENDPTAVAISEVGDTIASLADEIGLDPQDYEKWLTLIPHDMSFKGTPIIPGPQPSSSRSGCGGGCAYKIPNTVFSYWGGNAGEPGKWWVNWGGNIRILKKRGFHVVERSKEDMELTSAPFRALSSQKELHGFYFWGHGSSRSISWTRRTPSWTGPDFNGDILMYQGYPEPPPRWGGSFEENVHSVIWAGRSWYSNSYSTIAAALDYRMALVTLFACYSDGPAGRSLVHNGPNSIFWGSKTELVPVPFIGHLHSFDMLLPAGKQGTRK